MFTLDTNVIIYYLKEDPEVTPILDELFKNDAIVNISIITEIELLASAQLTSEEIAKIHNILRLCRIFDVNASIVPFSSQIRQQKSVKLPDAIIAATALYTGSPLREIEMIELAPPQLFAQFYVVGYGTYYKVYELE